jgi:hypothetical protein
LVCGDADSCEMRGETLVFSRPSMPIGGDIQEWWASMLMTWLGPGDICDIKV